MAINPSPILELVLDIEQEPVTIQEVDVFLGLGLYDCPGYIETADGQAQYYLIRSLIKAARKQAEHITRRAFTNQTWKFYLDEFPEYSRSFWKSERFYEREIKLAKPPVHDVTIVYQDTVGDNQLIDPDWLVVTKDFIPYVRLKSSYNWPSVLDEPASIQVIFRCGYYRESTENSPQDYDTVPDEVKTWIKMKVGEMYENRERSAGDKIFLKDFVDGLLDPYVIKETLYAGW